MKPDWRKIVVFVILVILSCMVPNHFIILPIYCEGRSFGIPLSFYCSIEGPFNFNIFVGRNLFADIIFWYLFSCLIVWVYDKVKKRKK